MSDHNLLRPSLSHQLSKLHPTYRGGIKKKLDHVLDMDLWNHQAEYPPLDVCYRYLGQMQTRFRLMEKVQELIHKGLGYSYTQWSKELWELRTNSLKQIDLMNQLIDCHLAKGDKVYETCSGIESRGAEPASDTSGSGDVG